MHCVIGSGPSAVACAKALLARNKTVLMLDAGIRLETERACVVRQAADKNPAEWSSEEISAIKAGLSANSKGVPLKLQFGSDFPYRETDEKIPWFNNGAGLKPSLALGGLSNVWGAAALPHRESDISDWPIKNSELAVHYRAVQKFMGISSQCDDLEELFPQYTEGTPALTPSEQGKKLLNNLRRSRDKLRKRGWHFGQARVAVRAAANTDGAGCIYCGCCMYGCPYGCIYNSADTVRVLHNHSKFTYYGDVIVKTIEETPNKILINAFHRKTGEALSFEVDRAYLAAGVIPTAQIVLRSQKAYGHPLTLKDSQYFLVPLLMFRRTKNVTSEALSTLSQLFIEINQPHISSRSIHLQVYTYSDTIGEAIRHSLGPLKMLGSQLDGRMIIVQGYLHSEESSTMTLTLNNEKDRDCLQLDARINPKTRTTVKRVLLELLRQSRKIGGVVLPPMLQLAEPGRGFHSGGSFPMRINPKPFESDLLGRPHGWSRVHIVDASVLPAIPSTTITLPVMANAHRIGWDAAML